MIISTAEVFANGSSDKDVKSSAQRFVLQYYKDLTRGDKSKIKEYFFERSDEESIMLLNRAGWIVSHKQLDEEDLEHMVHIGKLISENLEKIEFAEMTIISKKPLIIEIGVIERYKPSSYPAYVPLEEIFILKNITGYKWKIIEITMPELP